MNNRLVILAFICYFLLFIYGESLACPDSCQCVQPFTVSCQSKITEFPKGIPTNTEKLKISSTDITHIPEDVLQNLVHLKEFHLHSNALLRSVSEKLFDNLHNLELINLSFNNISTIPSGLFTNLPKLSEVYMIKNKIVNLPQLLFKNVTNLSHINFGQNMISSLPGNLFDSSVTNLEIIDFNHNYLSDIPGNFFDSTTEKLEELLLANNKFNIMPVNAFKPLVKDNLYISISNNPLFCNCSMKPFADWSKNVKIHGDISCIDGVTVSDLSRIMLHTCKDEVSTSSYDTVSTRITTTFVNTTEKTTTTSNPPTAQSSKLPTTQQQQTIDLFSTRKNEQEQTTSIAPPDDGDTDTQDSSESSKTQRKTLILAISISAVALVVLVAFILWLFHTGLLSTRCNAKFNRSKVVILDAEGNVLVKDGKIIT